MSEPSPSWAGTLAGLIGGGGIGAVAMRWLSIKKTREESVDKRYERLVDSLQQKLDHAEAAREKLHDQIAELSRAHATHAARISELERLVAEQDAEIRRLSAITCSSKDCGVRRDRLLLAGGEP